MRNFNKRLANFLGDKILSTMSFFYVCVALDLIELPPVIKAHSVITWCTYLSQSVIQLVALPILAYQNKVQTDHHKTTVAHLKAIHKHLGIDSRVQAPLKQKQVAYTTPPKLHSSRGA